MIKKFLGLLVFSLILFSTSLFAGIEGDTQKDGAIKDLEFPLLFKVSHKESTESIKFSPDNKTLATASYDNTAKLWDMDGELLFSMSENTSDVNQILFNKDGSKIVTRSYGDTERAVVIYDRTTGEKLNTINRKKGSYYKKVGDIEFIPNTNSLVVGIDDYYKEISIYNLTNNTLVNTFNTGIYVDQFSITPDGKKIAIQYGKTIQIYYIDSGELYSEFTVDISDNSDSNSDADNIQFIDNTKLLTVYSSTGYIAIWDIKTSKLIKSIRGRKVEDDSGYNDIYYVKVIDDLIIFNYQYEYNKQAVDIFKTDGEYVGSLKNFSQGFWLRDFDISPDKTKLAISDDGGNVQVFDITSLNLKSMLLKPEIQDLEVILKDNNTLNIKFKAIQN